MDDLESLLDRLATLKIVRPREDRRHKNTTSPWHQTLDYLALLGDTQTGGKSVVALAVFEKGAKLHFCVATNNRRHRAATIRHLRWLLHELQSGEEAGKAEKILNESVKVSHRKVRNYAIWLKIWVQKAQNTLPKDGSEGLQFIRDLEDFIAPDQNYALLSQRAANLPDAVSYAVLRRILSGDYLTSAYRDVHPWRMIHHYLGRLGSWYKATKFLVRAFAELKFLHNPAIVCPLDTLQPFRGLRHRPDLLGLILAGHDTQVSLKRHSDWLEKIRTEISEERNGCKELAVHAEINVLEYFLDRNLHFLHGDRYVGCSKPSCYACSLYMRSHPLAPLPRPEHSNIWIKWSPPCYHGEQLPRKHIQRIVSRMLQHLQLEIDLHLDRGRDSDGRLLVDSLTDLSSSLPTLGGCR